MKEIENYQRLQQGEIHLYLIYPEAVDITGKNWLDQYERERANQFKFNKDRHLYITAHLFVRKVLSQYASLSPDAWRFKTNDYGKPFISNYHYGELCFNLSHTQGLIACVVAYKRAVGVDVEQYRQLNEFNALCQSVFSSLEVSDILSLNTRTAQQQRFFTYWTLKESYIKARGMGLSIPLQEFSFIEIVTGKWELHDDINLIDNRKHWRFFSDKIDEYYLAITVAIASSEIFLSPKIYFLNIL